MRCKRQRILKLKTSAPRGEDSKDRSEDAIGKREERCVKLDQSETRLKRTNFFHMELNLSSSLAGLPPPVPVVLFGRPYP